MPSRVPTEVEIQAAIAQVDTLAQDLMTKSGMPGMAVAVVHNGTIAFEKGYGVRRIGHPEPIDTDTVFQLASVSKSVGATVIASEVSKGAVSWDTPVRAHLPSLALSDPYVAKHVTIADMYSHRSGLTEHAGDLLVELGASVAQMIQKTGLEPLHPFRTAMRYTNTGMAEAAYSVANAAGTSWAALSQRDIYGPLSMTRTSSRFHDFVSRANHAWTHQYVNGAYVVGPVLDDDVQSPSGGVSSSVHDMAKWLTMLLHSGQYNGKQVVSSDALLQALLPRVINQPASTPAGRTGFYGYGFNIDTTQTLGTKISHSGAFSAGESTNYVALPSIDTGIVVLTNGYPLGYPEVLGAEFADLLEHGSLTQDWFGLYTPVFKALGGPKGKLVGKKRPTNPVPARALSAYVGTYPNAYFGAATVTKRGSRLFVTLGYNRTTYRLVHWSGGLFTFTPTGENATPGTISGASFTKMTGGRAHRLTLEYFDANEDGTTSGHGVFLR